MSLRHRISRFLGPIALLALFATPSAQTSAADYTPTASEAEEIQRLSHVYLERLDRGEHADAHAMYTTEMRRIAPLDAWRSHQIESRARWGEFRGREQTKVTWYLDPPNAPRRGLYVAVDYASRYAHLVRHTEYLIWYRSSAEGAFELTRHETATIVADTAAEARPAPAAKAPQ